MMEQYLRIKEEHPDAILLFHLGDFYEMFFDDALLASRLLEITLTGRDGGPLGRVPMCGIPVHAAEGYIARLIEKGQRVAVCDQVEDPKTAKGVVRRAVTRVITPGTVIEGNLLDEKTNSFLAALVGGGEEGWGLAVADVSTGEVNTAFLDGPRAEATLIDELSRLAPREILVPDELASRLDWSALPGPPALTVRPGESFALPAVAEVLRAQFPREELERAAWARQPAMIRALGGLFAYLAATQLRPLAHLRRVRVYTPGRYMVLDAATRRNLELTRSLVDGGRRGTLLGVLDYTETAMGGRLLRGWIEQPLLDPELINERLQAVGELAADTLRLDALRPALSRIYDLERLAARVAYGTANARDMLALKASLEAVAALREAAGGLSSALALRLVEALDPCPELTGLLGRALADEPPVTIREGGLIREGYDAEVDRLRRLGREGKDWLLALEAEERERTGIRSLKVGYNRVFGYYIEVTKSNLHLVPPEYQRRQTLANAERFVTPALKEYEEQIVHARERLVECEYRLFVEIRERVLAEVPRLQRLGTTVARLDALYALAVAAVRHGYTAPRVTAGGRIFIREGRHPVVEQALGPGAFVPNDALLDDDGQRMLIITGPNMAGKSTYMRQVVLIVLMAQMGSFVPAAEAEIGVVDRIFTRIGASDDLAGGASTFMVEMRECRTIVEQATPHSLVIMDEVGRGTATFDGMSLARALLEYIHERVGAKTLFSTHYHELTALEDSLQGVMNYTTRVAEDGQNVIFLRKVVPGRANRSYGLHVARLAGLPEEVIGRAAVILATLEREQWSSGVKEAGPGARVTQLQMFIPEGEQVVLEELRRLKVDELTPLQALNRLDELQRKLKEK
ncbi:MAG: DNA mismatch repair protein MutS [Bacillota bacterium]|nr:DNA mismatch repair protein MutS [Bacillota bacterium]